MRAETLPDLLADVGVRLKRLSPGHSEKLLCPRCHGGRTKELSLSVTVDDDGQGVVYVCHRGSCGWSGGGRTGSARGMERERAVRRPAAHTVVQITNRPDWLYRFFSDRRIGAKTVDAFGLYAAVRRFGDEERPAIVFPYLHRGEVVNRKYRPHPGKTPQLQEPDALPTLFNVDAIVDAEEIVWVEGEPDVLALWECGVRHAVTLKDGAPKEARFRDDDKRFEALRTHAELLTKAKRIILAGDNDAPGQALREELARRLGRHRCRVVEWPVGCKDACDALGKHGPDAVLGCIAEAVPYPIEGLQEAFVGKLLALQSSPPPAVMTTGAIETDAVLKLPADGRLITVTGFPSSGKTTWARFVMIHTAMKHDRKWCVFSPEMQPWEQFIATCAEALIGKPFWPHPVRDRMTVPEVLFAERWLTGRVVMMVSDAEDDPPTLDWVIEHARLAVLRDGVTDVLIDPWNEVDHQRGDMTETDYIGRSLQRLKAFAYRHEVNVWIIAHPKMPPQLKPGETRKQPGPYDINGSAHWANKTDLGLTVHSPSPGYASITVWKARFRRWGKRDAFANLPFDDVVGRYGTDDGDASA